MIRTSSLSGSPQRGRLRDERVVERMAIMRTSAEIRDDLIKILELDLVGPWPGHERENEILDHSPSREYLTGFIVPYEPPDVRPGRICNSR